MAVNNWARQRQNFVCSLLLMDILEDNDEANKKKRRRRETWSRTWLQKRAEKGAFNQIVQELRVEDAVEYKRFFRMSEQKFKDLLEKIQDCLKREDTMMRSSIKPNERLAVTLRFLALGETFSSLEKQFRISRTAISYIVVEVSCGI